MRGIRRTLRAASVLATVLCVAGTPFAAAGSDFDIDWFTLEGGGVSSGSAFELRGVAGQADAGTMTGGMFELSGGFLTDGQHAETCAPDIDGSGVVDVQDLLSVLDGWGACPPNCDADVNGDDAVDVQDLLAVLSAWGPCP